MRTRKREDVERAFKHSLRKWAGIIVKLNKDGGAGDCALCSIFIGRYPHNGATVCDGCPISQRHPKGYGCCADTPYNEFYKLASYLALKRDDEITDDEIAEYRELARKELAFLIETYFMWKKGML